MTYSDEVVRTLEPGARYYADLSGTSAEYTIRYDYPDAPAEYVTVVLSYSVETGWHLGLVGRAGGVVSSTPIAAEVARRMEDTLSDMGGYYAINERTIRAFYGHTYPLAEN